MSHSERKSTLLRRVCAAAIVLGLVGAAGAASAEEKSLAEREKLTGDWGGTRTALEARGIEIGIEYIGEVLGISGGAYGGAHPGRGPFATFEGRLGLSIDADLEKFMGWTGAKFHAKAFQIHNIDDMNAASYVGSLADPSNIDALATTRLFTLWLEQSFGSFASVRIGQLAADDEFLTSDTAGGLINGTFGWATIMSSNLPSGGPAYPLATPGVRLQVNPTENIALLGAVFSGDPAGKNCYTNNPDADPQECNKHGTTFSFSGGAFWIGEAQYNVNKGENATGLAASYKIGAWYHTGSFADQRYGIDSAGVLVPLANDPENALYHRGNYGFYGVIDQMIWRGPVATASIFLRGGVVPADRNLEAWYIDGGIGFTGLVPGRDKDKLTIGLAYSRISDDAIDADNDVISVSGLGYPVRSGETVLEVSYAAQITPWWIVQPDFQCIWNPGGNVLVDEDDPTLGTVPTAYVFGVRSTMAF